MANSATTAFDGTAIDMILEELVLGTESISKGLINIIPSKFDKVYLPRMSHVDNPLQARAVTPTTPTDITYDERVITPGDMMAYAEWTTQEFGENLWEQFWPNGAHVDLATNTEVLRAILSTMSKKVNNQLDRLIWQGDTGGAAELSYFDGYLKTMGADADVVDVTYLANPVPDESNIVDILNAVIAAIPDAVFAQADVKMVCSHKVARNYDAAIRNLDFKGTDVTAGPVRTYGGIPLVAVGGMTDTQIVAGSFASGNTSNAHAATWMDNDRNNIIVDKVQNNSELYFAKLLFRFGVQYGFGSEMTLYTGV